MLEAPLRASGFLAPCTIIESIHLGREGDLKQSDPRRDLVRAKLHTDPVSLANRGAIERNLLAVLVLRGEALCRVQ